MLAAALPHQMNPTTPACPSNRHPVFYLPCLLIASLQVFTLTAVDAQASLQLVRAGVPVAEQIAPPVAAARRRKGRRLQQQQDGDENNTGSSSSSWSQQPDLPDSNAQLKVHLDKELQQKLRTSQHATSALAGVKVERMVHVHAEDDNTMAGMDHAGHQK